MNNYCIPPTSKKVSLNTSSDTNKIIRDKTISDIKKLMNSGEPILIKKIEKLNREWDTERLLETNAASIILLSSFFGYNKSKCGFFLLTGTIGYFLLKHAVMGWCPPLPIIRKMGVRTSEEIFNEKMVYKKLRGDFSRDTECAEELIEKAEK